MKHDYSIMADPRSASIGCSLCLVITNKLANIITTLGMSIYVDGVSEIPTRESNVKGALKIEVCATNTIAAIIRATITGLMP